MRKISFYAVALALTCLVTSPSSRAEEAGMLELTGSAVSVTGWQRASTGKYLDTTAGVLADGLAVPAAAGTEQFGFFIDQVEVDLAKSFGENIRFRADLDFAPFTGGATPGRVGPLAITSGGTADFLVEQIYTTANIPAGNGMELLVGRFNSGIGLDPIDRGELSTVSYSSAHRLILPHNMTGARLGYDFTDSFRWETFVVNDLADRAPAATSPIPSLGFNALWSWGGEEDMSWFKFSGAGGPETPGLMKHWSFLGDAALQYGLSDSTSLGVEGVYRQDNATTGATDNDQYMGGTLKLGYGFSDVWDGTLRYGFTWDLDAGSGGSAVTVANNTFSPGLAGTLTNGGVRHDLALATGYAITDAARFGLEGRVDLTNPSAAANGSSGQNFGFAGVFAYNF
jgi:hypothetical protein